MNGKLGLGRLWRWVQARPEADAVVDAADVGTAYGMELSIFEAEQREAGDAAAADEPTETPPTTPRAGR